MFQSHRIHHVFISEISSWFSGFVWQLPWLKLHNTVILLLLRNNHLLINYFVLPLDISFSIKGDVSVTVMYHCVRDGQRRLYKIKLNIQYPVANTVLRILFRATCLRFPTLMFLQMTARLSSHIKTPWCTVGSFHVFWCWWIILGSKCLFFLQFLINNLPLGADRKKSWFSWRLTFVVFQMFILNFFYSINNKSFNI